MMTDGWPLYESRLKGKLHVISKRYTQRIERHNLNLRQHLARLGRKSLSFSKSVELHDKVIGHYRLRADMVHYLQVGVITLKRLPLLSPSRLRQRYGARRRHAEQSGPR
jgi:insertion element IS1 protein InsB